MIKESKKSRESSKSRFRQWEDGNGMSAWKEFKLGNVSSKIGSGATPNGGENAYKSEGISLIRSQNVYDFTFSNDGLAFIDDKQAYELRNVEVLENDILINITGESVTRCCIVPKQYLPARVNQHVAIIRTIKEITDFKYLFYYLQSIKPELHSIAEIGCTRRALTKGMLEGLSIILPPLPEQRAIASVLSSLDDKIDLLHRQNKTLEAMAETLFRQWFIEPSLNPSQKEGNAEEGWEETTLEQHIEVLRGLSYKGSGLTDAGLGIPMHNLNSVYEGGGYKHEGIKFYNGEYKERHLICPGDIIVTNTEQGHEFKLIGFPAIVPDIFGSPGLFSQHIYKITPKKQSYLPNEYIYYLLMTPSVREQIISATNGSTVNMLAIDGLQRPEFKLPPKDKVFEFKSIVRKYWEKSGLNFKQIRTLEKLRDTLLPKLMSGEIRIKDSEKLLEALS
ncbi:restriction endonuclease subunit S [Candidatus Kuenenia sp.]|uniref:restriction endonuclease subunit S n=1 Tax=Candidatus Kuenenia sp. TaxID=2499824 RepID=UPI003AF496D2|nr:restriction endonuclease subunit S [Phycisphaerales bacterium]